MDKFFNKFPISTIDSDANHLISIVKYGSYFRINFNFKLNDKKLETYYNSLGCIVNYNNYDSSIKIDCVNIPSHKFVTTFNDLLKKVMIPPSIDLFGISDSTNIKICVYEGSILKCYNVPYDIMKGFEIKE